MPQPRDSELGRGAFSLSALASVLDVSSENHHDDGFHLLASVSGASWGNGRDDGFCLWVRVSEGS